MKSVFLTAAVLSLSPLTLNVAFAADATPAVTQHDAHSAHHDGCGCTETCSKGCNHAHDSKNGKNHKCDCSHCDCAKTGSCKADKKDGVAACSHEGHEPHAQPSATR